MGEINRAARLVAGVGGLGEMCNIDSCINIATDMMIATNVFNKRIQ